MTWLEFLEIAGWAVVIILGLTVMLSIVGKVQGKYHLLQYLYFLRVSIGTALLLFIGPFVLISGPVEQYARNWLDLDFVGIAVVTFLSLLLSWVVLNKSFVNYLLIAPRNNLVLSRIAQQEAKKSGVYQNSECPFLKKKLGMFPVRFFFFSLFAFPLVVVCFFHSSIGTLMQLGGIAIGAISALLLWIAWQMLIHNQAVDLVQRGLGGNRQSLWKKLRDWLVILTSEAFVKALFQGYERQSPEADSYELDKARIGAWIFLAYQVYTHTH